MTVSNNYPNPVQPGQQFLLATTMHAVCLPSDISQGDVYYLGMVEVQDANSGHEITFNSAPIGYVTGYGSNPANVTVTVTNLITPPGGNVAWRLKLIASVVNSANEYFNHYEDTALTQYLTVNVGTVE